MCLGINGVKMWDVYRVSRKGVCFYSSTIYIHIQHNLSFFFSSRIQTILLWHTLASSTLAKYRFFHCNRVQNVLPQNNLKSMKYILAGQQSKQTYSYFLASRVDFGAKCYTYNELVKVRCWCQGKADLHASALTSNVAPYSYLGFKARCNEYL